ncbi:aldehyde dehydrogenase family protein [bacterium]|nr:aldehyde dehydrogenase family protein [bacterium]
MQSIEYKGNYIAGEFIKPQRSEGERQIYSPGDLDDLVFDFSFDYTQIDDACSAAKEAFLPWARLDLSERIEYLNKLKTVYENNTDLIAETISRETGKPLWEAQGEAKAMVGKITITVNHSVDLIKTQTIKEAIPSVDGKIWFKPRGVMAVLGPFNFPGHLPNGHIVPALMTGNTIVFKPSEKTSAMGQLFADLIHQAGFPKGVFNVVHGDGEVGKRLAKHAAVDGVLFTGSYDVGLKIKKDTINDYWKILALEMGGKNSTIVWDDADLEKAVYETLIGAFLTSGQRCSCTSRIVLNKKISDKFIKLFHEKAKKLSIGHWKDNPFMGPLISKQSFDAYLKFQDIANREGAESLMRGKELGCSKKGYYVTPSINLIKSFDSNSVYQNTEIFGPGKEMLNVANKLVKLALKKSRLNHSWLTTSGSMANENALKMCRQKTDGARKIIAMQAAFAGRTTMMAEVTDNPTMRVGLPRYDEILRVPFYDANNPDSTKETLEILKEHLKNHKGDICAFMFEPMQGEGGYTVAPREFFIPLFEEVKKAGIPIWADEIQTFCRTGEFFAFETLDFGDYIDICTVAKTLQAAATLYTDDLNPKPGLIAGTFAGSTAALSAGYEVLNVLESENYMGPDGKISKIHNEFVAMLNNLNETTCKGQLQDAGGLGLMVGVTPLDGSREKMIELVQVLYKNGLMCFGCGKGPFRVRFLIPAVMTSEDIQVTKQILEKSIQEII